MEMVTPREDSGELSSRGLRGEGGMEGADRERDDKKAGDDVNISLFEQETPSSSITFISPFTSECFITGVAF